MQNDGFMTTCQEELARKYVPHFRYDKTEPFSLEAIGYTVFTENAKSPSSRRFIRVHSEEVVIEYAVYFDFDIQHLYDLEHVFVYVNGAGDVVGVESSFHGKFLNSYIEGQLEFDDTHPILCVQPGKHALLPAPHYFELALDRDAACNELAGCDGLLVAPMFESRLTTDAETNQMVEHYIRNNYSFIPSWEFVKSYPGLREPEGVLMPYEELDKLIVKRIQLWKEKILEVCKKECKNAED